MKRRKLVFAAGWLVIGGGMLMAQSTQRVSVDSNGVQGNNFSSSPSISADGRLVAFRSVASNLVPGDTGSWDVFVHDRQTQQTARVSIDSSGTPGNDNSDYCSISADGRFVAFESAASNLVAGDTNGWPDIFVHDRQTGQTTRVSVDSAGAQGNLHSNRPSMSADGRYVAFMSYASNLVAGDTNGIWDVFVHDLQTGVTTRESVDSAGTQGDNGSIYPSISAAGRYVAFDSYASNLVANDTNGWNDIFVRDRQTGQTTRVSVDSNGLQTDSFCQYPSISADGRFVAFDSRAANLVADDANNCDDIFVHDRQTGQTRRVSISSGNTEANAISRLASMSADGMRVAFWSEASNLVAGDTNAAGDVFIHDLQSALTTRVSVSSSGTQANANSSSPSTNADGRYVAFESYASNLVTSDTNAESDVFVRDRFSYDPPSAFCFGDGSLVTACPCAPPNFVPSPSGAPGHGCANSFELDGGLLAAAGAPVPDSIAFTAEIGPSYLGYGFLVKGNAQDTGGIANGDGVRCVSGALVRFGGHNAGTNGAAAGFWTYPNSAQTTPVSTATAQSPGQSAWYQLIYRNPAASFCSSGTTNWTNGIKVVWP